MLAKYAQLGSYATVDEAMVAMKNRVARIIRHIKNKPDPHGVRFWCIADRYLD